MPRFAPHLIRSGPAIEPFKGLVTHLIGLARVDDAIAYLDGEAARQARTPKSILDRYLDRRRSAKRTRLRLVVDHSSRR